MNQSLRLGLSATLVAAAAVSVVTVLSAQAQAPSTPPAAAAQAAAAPPAGNVENGRATYKRVGCYECHNLEAQGGPGTAPRLGPNPLPFPRFSAYVRKPTGTMPPYRLPVLTDQEMADIHAFLRAQPRPPALSTIPLLAPSQFK